jgi:chromosome partitioning protein
MTYTIAISNEKGGVAKTTTTLSLGGALAELGHRVLLIDMDPQANLTLALGFEPGEASKTSANVLIESLPLQNAIHKSDFERIDLVPCNARIESAEQFLPVRSSYLTTLRSALGNIATFGYDYVLLDCPPALGAITLNALAASDLLLIPTQAEYFSAYALRNMMTVIRRIRKEANPNLAYRILVTLLDRRNRTHRSIYEQLISTFGDGIFETVIEMDTKLRESPIAGQPITRYMPSSRGSLQYRVLAEELIQYAKETHQQTA